MLLCGQTNMTLIFSSMDFKYELEGVVKLFLPAQNFKITVSPTEEGHEGDICFVKREQRGVMTYLYVLCRINGTVASEAGLVLNSEKDYRSACEMTLARYLYTCLSRITGLTPQWGIITGVRPVKQINAMSAKGLSDGEIRKKLSEDFLCSTKKINVAFAVAKVQERILSELDDDSFSLYVSIPFCTSRCSYCSFVSQSVESSLSLIPQYVTNLCAEIRHTGELMTRLGKRLDTVYFGGGTPTAIDACYIEAIMQTIEESFDTSTVREYTVEAGRADTITEAKLDAIKNGGAKRISINPQTLSDCVLRAIGRKHTVEQFYDAYELARSKGFEVINTDLIAGLPTDTLESFMQTIDGIIELQPENITVHTLSIKRTSDLNQTEDKNLDMKTEQMIDYATDRLVENGYLPYYLYRQRNMLDNQENIGWSKPGRESLYNTFIMEENQTIIAVGAGGSTKLVDRKWDRLKRIFNYKLPLEYNKHFDLMLQKKKEIEEFFTLEKAREE